MEETRLRMRVGKVSNTLAERKMVYFLKLRAEVVPKPESPAESRSQMPQYMQWGVINGNNLSLLERVISFVYLPIFSSAGALGTSAAATSKNINISEQAAMDAVKAVANTPSSSTSTTTNNNNSNSSNNNNSNNNNSNDLTADGTAGDDFAAGLRRFAMHMRRTIQQVEGEIKLRAPPADLATLQDTQTCLANKELMVQLERCCEAWQRTVVESMQQLQTKAHNGPGPLAEIEYWIERSSMLTALLEQLQQPVVLAAMQLLQAVKSPAMADLEYGVSQAKKLQIEAVDNVKFLSTLERHFKNITNSSSFSQTTELLPSLMNALRMVWIISRHYNTDNRMVPLLERIAWLLCDKVTQVIEPRTVHRWEMRY